jgi:alkylhydroperoxidase family enzyme
MNEFKIYDVTSAPADSRADLEKIKLNHGTLPNVYAVMAESPLLLKAYVALKDLFGKATLSNQDRKIVLLTLSRETGSPYDTAAHSVAAEKHSVPVDVIEAIRAGQVLKDKKLESLRSFTVHAVEKRGLVPHAPRHTVRAEGVEESELSVRPRMIRHHMDGSTGRVTAPFLCA